MFFSVYSNLDHQKIEYPEKEYEFWLFITSAC